jgi:hypothetical protein
MLQHICGMISSSPLKFTTRWIESHQDDKKYFSKIDHWGQLNVECDGLAKSYWNTTVLTNGWVSSMQFGFENWSPWIKNRKMSQVEKTKLYEVTFSDRTKQYWHRKHSLLPELITSIHWEACAAAMGRLPFGKKRWLIRQATRGWQTGILTRQPRP